MSQESGRDYGPDERGDGSRVADRTREATAGARERIDETRERAQEKVDEGRERAQATAEHGRERAAEGAERGADQLRSQAEGRGGMQEKAGVKAADAMERTAGYLRENRTDEIWADVERMAREHPLQALGGAVVAGFVIGRVLR